MTFEDILLRNFEYNKTVDENHKRPEKILKFFRLSAVKDRSENSDFINRYDNIYVIPVKTLQEILQSISVNGSRIYNSVDELKYETDRMEDILNNILSQTFINQNEYIEITSDLNKKLMLYNYYNGNSTVYKDNFYVISEDLIDELQNLNTVYIPKEYIVYSENDKDNIINKFNQKT